MSEDTNEIVEETTTPVEETPAEPVVETPVEEPVELTTEDYYREKKLREEAEAKLKTALAQKEHFKQKVEKAPLIKTENQDSLKDELILIAKGYDEEVIEQASIIAKAKGIGIKDALKDPLIEAYVEKKETTKKKEKAQLGTSSGSSNSQEMFKPGQTREEHMAVWAKEMEKF